MSAAGWAVQVPAIDAPWGGVVSAGAGGGAAAAVASLGRVELPEQLRREGVARLERDHLLEDAHRRLGVALGQVVVGEHEPGRGRVRVARQ